VLSPVYLVGGSVRDALLGRQFEDLDFTTPLDPDRVEALVRAAGRRPYLIGKKFGTVGFKIDGHIAEVTTFRTETYPEGTKPRVSFVDKLEDDLSRRDFTINAMALDADEIVDPFGGQRDLEQRVIRAVGDASERFAEDPLRMLRAARFASQLAFDVHPDTVAAMRELADRIMLVARERWNAELDKLLMGPGVSAGMRLLAETGLLRYLLPELQLQVGLAEKALGSDDAGRAGSGRAGSGRAGAGRAGSAATSLFERTLAAVESAEPDITKKWAALLGNVAEPYAHPATPDSLPSRRDLIAGALAERIALYLKWSTQRRRDVVAAVEEHARHEMPGV